MAAVPQDSTAESNHIQCLGSDNIMSTGIDSSALKVLLLGPLSSLVPGLGSWSDNSSIVLIPQTELAMWGSHGLVRGALRGPRWHRR